MIGSGRSAPRAACLGVIVGCVLVVGVHEAQAQSRNRDRPIRVGNSNVLFAGGGYTSHDHPMYGAHGLVNFAYQRRVLRREVRAIPVWVRGAVNFTAEERTLYDTYTYWDNPENGENRPPETVDERTSDFAVRIEAVADLLHTRTSALYVGGGFVIHSVSFRSRGRGSDIAAGLETRENAMAPSAVLGGRVFMATQPYTAYVEARLGRTYGRAAGPQDVSPPRAPSVGQFELNSVSNFSIEGGVAFHW